MGERLGVIACSSRALWRWIASSIVVVVIAATALSTPAQSQTPNWDAVVANAEREGSVTIYSAAPGAPPVTEIDEPVSSNAAGSVLTFLKDAPAKF